MNDSSPAPLLVIKTSDVALGLEPLFDPKGEVARAIARWSEAMRPAREAAERMAAQFEAVIDPLRGAFDRLAVEEARCARLEAAGWLAHTSSPTDLMSDETLEGKQLSILVESYYRKKWKHILKDFKDSIDSYVIDSEAKATFHEALSAHEAGLYRCAARLLFPEIERVSRADMHGGAMDKMASQNKLRDAISGLTPAEMSGSGIYGYRFYMKLSDHLYAHIKDDAALAGVLADPVPNRHAVVHGYAPYNSFQSSINALIISDYIFRGISAIKRYSTSSEIAAA